MADNGSERITRMQGQIEELERDVKILLRAQVLQGDMQRVHGEDIQGLTKLMAQAMKRQDLLDERVDKLVSAVGEIARRMDVK